MVLLGAIEKKKRSRSRPTRYPLGIELQYSLMLRGIVREVGTKALAQLEAQGPVILEELDRVRADAPTGWAARFLDFLTNLAMSVADRLKSGLDQVSAFSQRVNTFNRNDFAKQVRSAYGVDILRGEPELAPILSAWEAENLALIKSLPERMIEQLRSEMMKGFVEGASLRDLTRIVRERTGANESRAKLIARDQVGRLNGQLAEHRQRSIGVKDYIWRTSQDERVRPTHRVRNGKTYSWNDKGIKPGSEIRCRCNAEPVFPEVFEA